ncbi:MAG: Holliday junction resolvase RuvX [Chlamydiales bacterium]|nr:Holliday junction resolvase RuvX [Chlamydiia bacterium]MCP5508427.1 Holliday junction resolvase RuvX [Chlamydiales bacterium]
MVKKKRIIGIDYGVARIGVAFSDETKTIASPLDVVKTEKKLDATIEKLLALLELHQKEWGYEAERIVVGMPLMMSGKSGLIADEVNHFIQKLSAMTPIPVVSWDERLTSVQAERTMRESNMSRKKRAQHVDKVAAAIILQSYLDSLRTIL